MKKNFKYMLIAFFTIFACSLFSQNAKVDISPFELKISTYKGKTTIVCKSGCHFEQISTNQHDFMLNERGLFDATNKEESKWLFKAQISKGKVKYEGVKGVAWEKVSGSSTSINHTLTHEGIDVKN
jgi:uncharacterized lipoprotein YehR (DUF1307 family)